MAEIVRGAESAFPNRLAIRDRFDASPSLRRFVERLGLFLTLVGLTALVVGGVGVGNAITAYLERRRETIAIVKAWVARAVSSSKYTHCKSHYCRLVPLCWAWCWGACTFRWQTLFGSILPVALVPDIYAAPLLVAAGFGVLSAAGFALWPLGKLKRFRR